VGGGSWKKVDRKVVMDGRSLTTTEDESEQSEEEGWVYDVYVREKVDETRKLVGPIEVGAVIGVEPQISEIKPGDYGVLVISNSDDEEWFYEGGWEDNEKSDEEGLSDDEDSNAEDYRANDYPDEDDENGDDGYGEYIVGCDDGESGSESDTYEKIYSGEKWGLCSSAGGSQRRRGCLPGEEEYDLGEGSGSDEGGAGDSDSQGYKVRKRLEKGVWGFRSAGVEMGDGDSDKEME